MSTTYFKTSNIEKLTKKSRNKNKKITDKNVADEKGVKDDKLVEGFDPTNMLGGNGVGNDPFSNILGSSDTSGGGGGGGGSGSGGGGGSGSGSGDGSGSGSGSATSDTSPTSTTESNTQKAAGEQLDPNSIIIFCLHALLSVVFAYVWGFLASNAIFLITESKDNMNYILPVDEYAEPYSRNVNKKSRWDYGFPYNLEPGRIMDEADSTLINKNQNKTTWYFYLSEKSQENSKTGFNRAGFFGALVQYLFEAVYGGLGKGGRTLIRVLLSIFSIKDKELPDKKGTWYGDDMMENRTGLKIVAFLVWPFIMMSFFIPVVGIWSALLTFIFGILQTHIVWGLIFSFTIGIFVAMGNGFYMALQTIYIFFIYPWSNSNSDTKTKYRDIFQSLIPYMLFIFYYQICIYGYVDLGGAGGAGIMLIVLGSILLQYIQNMM